MECRAAQMQLVTDLNPQPNVAEDFYFGEELPRTTRLETNVGHVAVKVEITRAPHPTDEIPMVLIPGYTGHPKAYGNFAHHLALNGRDVIRYSTDRRQNIFREPLAEQAKAAYAATKAARAVLDFEQIDTIGHSMGNSISAKFAAEKGTLIRSHNALGGAGMHDANQLFGMIGRLLKVGAFEVIPNSKTLLENTPPGTLEAEVIHIGRNLLQLLREGLVTAVEDSRPDFEKAKDQGVLINSYLYGKDGFFRPTDVLAHSGYLFDRHIIIPKATHCYPLIAPESHAGDITTGSIELNQTRRLTLANPTVSDAVS